MTSKVILDIMEEQRPKKRPRSTSEDQHQKKVMMIPTFVNDHDDVLAATIDTDEFVEAWETFQVVHLPRKKNNDEASHPSLSTTGAFNWKHIQDVFGKLSEKDKESFCIETAPKKKATSNKTNNNSNDQQEKDETIPPESFFQVVLPSSSSSSSHGQEDADITPTPYYCSFLVQKDDSSLQNLLSRVPVPTIKNHQWRHEPCVWIFFGRNPLPPPMSNGGDNDDDDDNENENDDLQGRPEHTDSISHDGTWHYQLSGVKRWLLRPTAKLLEHWKNKTQGTTVSKEQFANWEQTDNDNDSDNDSDYRITVECRQGDILVINTRLWFHQTILPPQSHPSVSYARDFWAHPKKPSSTVPPTDDNSQQQQSQDNDNNESSSSSGCIMTNVDGLYATNDIAAGTIVFRESDMPDCELHRSSENPNCEVVELEDGSGAVVSSRDIVAGEFFCIAESSSEEEEDGDEDEEEEGQGSDDDGDFEDVEEEE